MNAPPFSYFGGKIRMSKHIVPLLPLHACYVEPFCGGAAMLFAKPRPSWPNYVEVLNDIDRQITNFFEVLQTQGADLVRRIHLTPLSEEAHTTACKVYKAGDFEGRLDAAYWFFINVEQSFGNVLSGGWRRSVTSNEAKAWANASHWQRLWPYIDRLKSVQIANTDALTVIKQFDSPHTLTYCDPPYVGTCHGHYARLGRKAFGVTDFEALIACLDDCQGSILLSTYDVPCVSFPATWERFEFAASCTVSAVGKTAPMGRADRSSKAVVTGRERIEVVWRRGPKVAPRPEIQKLYNSTSLFADIPNASRSTVRRKLFG